MGLGNTVARPVHAFFRGVGALLLILGAFGAGFFERAPLVVVPMAGLWCLAKGLVLLRARSPRPPVLPALGLQVVFVVVLYGLGRLASEYAGGDPGADSITTTDWALLALLGVSAVPMRVWGGSAVAAAAEMTLE